MTDKTAGLDFSQLLGFDGLTRDGQAIDFRDDQVAARLGAKVGTPEPAVETADKTADKA